MRQMRRDPGMDSQPSPNAYRPRLFRPMTIARNISSDESLECDRLRWKQNCFHQRRESLSILLRRDGCCSRSLFPRLTSQHGIVIETHELAIMYAGQIWGRGTVPVVFDNPRYGEAASGLSLKAMCLIPPNRCEVAGFARDAGKIWKNGDISASEEPPLAQYGSAHRLACHFPQD
jgi:hypothetical protein